VSPEPAKKLSNNTSVMRVLTSHRILRSTQKRKNEVIILSSDHACAAPPWYPLRSCPKPASRPSRQKQTPAVRQIRAAVHKVKSGGELKEGESIATLQGYAAFIAMVEPELGFKLMDELSAAMGGGPK